MTIERFQELVTLNSVGALDGDDRNEFSLFMETADELTCAQVEQLENVATNIASVVKPLRSPAPRVKDNLMRKIAERHAAERALEGPAPIRYQHYDGIHTLHTDKMEWLKHPVPGVSFKVLSDNQERGYVTMLMRVEPGTVFPEHHHSGPEECYIMSGSFSLAGKKLVAGDFHHGDSNTDHGTLMSEEGCTLLLVVPKEDYIPPVV